MYSWKMARARAQVVTDERIDQVKGRPALLSGFLRFDRDHRVVFASAEVARVFGVSVSDIRGKTLADLGVPSDSVERWERALATVFATGRETVVEFTQSAAGRTLRCRLVAEPGPDGGVDNVLALVQESVAPGAPAAWDDLVAELHAAHARLEAVIQQMPAGVIIAEAPSGRLILGNDQVGRIWRQPFYPSDSIPDYDAYRGFHPDGRPYRPEEWPLARSIATGEVVTDEEIEILRGDGTRGTILVSSAPIYGRDGRVVAGVATFSDITERKRAVDGLRLVGEVSGVLATSLDYQETLRRVARLAVPALADYCVVDLVDDAGATRRVAAVHADPDKAPTLERLRRYPPDLGGPNPIARAIATGRPEVMETVTDEMLRRVARNPEHLRLMRALAPTSMMIVPLVARSQPLGAMSFFVSGGTRAYTTDDLALASEFAARAAFAVDNARLYEGERRARQEAERAVEWTTRLQTLTAALSHVAMRDAVVSTIARTLDGLLGMRSLVVAIVQPDRRTLSIEEASGEALAPGDVPRVIAIDGLHPLAQAYRSRQVVVADLGSEAGDRGARGALVAVPLVTDGSAVGALGLVLAVGTVLDDEERGFLMALGLQCGQALERARLAEAERAAQAERALAQQRLAFLAEASALLAGSLDYETTLRRVAETVVPALADWCAVDLVERDGEVRRVAIAHVDPAKVSWARELAERYPYDPGAPQGLAKVLRTGEPEFWPEITDAMLAAAARDEEHLALLRRTGFSSAMIVPLVARGRSIGALSFIAAESGRHYTEADLMFAEEVARRAALAVENARLYREAREAEERVRRQAIRARALAEASQAFAEARLDAHAVLAVVAERTAALIGDACIIRLLSEDGAWLVPAAVFHPDPQASRVTREVLAAVRHRATEGLNGRVVATGEPLLIAETTPEALRHHTKREYLPHLEAFPVYGLLVVPLRALGRTVGTVALSRSAPGRPYTLDDQAFLLDIVERAGQALENAWLYRDAQGAVTVAERHAAQLRGLTDAALSINAELSLEETLQIVTDQARSLIGSHLAFTTLVPGQDWSRAVTARALSDKYAAHRDASPSPALASLQRLVVTTNQPLRLTQAELEAHPAWRGFGAAAGQHPPLRGWLAAPLIGRDGRNLGLIQLSDKYEGEFSESDEAILVQLAQMASVALENARLYEESQQLLRAREEFLSIASHELKTPFTTIKGYAQLLERQLRRQQGVPAAVAQTVGKLNAQMDRFQEVVDDLLDVSRLQQGRLQLRLERCDLVPIAREVFERFQHSPERTPAHRLAFDAPSSLEVRCDSTRIDQIMSNLLSNALKYSEGGEVALRLAREGSEAVIAVSDQGVGIPEGDRERIFQPFYRSDVARSSASGSGLGLYITKQIVEQHGGTIAVASAPGGGTVFTVRLPLSRGGD